MYPKKREGYEVKRKFVDSSRKLSPCIAAGALVALSGKSLSLQRCASHVIQEKLTPVYPLISPYLYIIPQYVALCEPCVLKYPRKPYLVNKKGHYMQGLSLPILLPRGAESCGK